MAFCEHFALESLLQRPLSELTTMAASGDFLQKVATGKRTGDLRNFKLALPSMVRLLDRATPDPWDSGQWHTEDVRYPARLAGARSISMGHHLLRVAP